MILQELNVKIGLLLDEFQKNAAKVKDEAKAMENTFSQLKGALAALGIFSFMKGAVAEFAESERAVNRLQFTLRSLGLDWKAITPQIKAYADETEKLTGFHGDDLIPQIDRLIKLTGNYKEAMALMPDILDITASGTMSLSEATEAVGRAFIGDQRGLGTLAVQFGIARRDAKDFGDIMETVRSKVEGAAESQKGMARDLMNFDNAWKEFQQNAGGSVQSVIHFGSEVLKVGLPIAVAIDNVRKAQDKLMAKPVEWIADKIKDWAGLAKLAKTESMKMIDDLLKSTERASLEVKQTRPTIGRVSKEEQEARIKTAEDAAKAEYEINKNYGDQYIKLMQSNSIKIAVLRGKDSAEYKKHKSDELKVTRDIEMAKMNLEDKTMNNRVSAGVATTDQLAKQMKKHLEELKEQYGENSDQYQSYLAQYIEVTKDANRIVLESGQAVISGLSVGFEALFTSIAQEGADASKAAESFARAMGKSFLNAIAAIVEGEAARGMAGYLANLLGLPLMAGATTAYSLPLIASLAATSGLVRGLAAAMAEGGTLTRPGLVMMAEKRSGEPETAIPLSRMDEVFQKYQHFLGKKQGTSAGGNTVIIQRVIDNRGAIVATSDFDKGKAAKQVGDLLTRYGVIKKGTR